MSTRTYQELGSSTSELRWNWPDSWKPLLLHFAYVSHCVLCVQFFCASIGFLGVIVSCQCRVRKCTENSSVRCKSTWADRSILILTCFTRDFMLHVLKARIFPQVNSHLPAAAKHETIVGRCPSWIERHAAASSAPCLWYSLANGSLNRDSVEEVSWVSVFLTLMQEMHRETQSGRRTQVCLAHSSVAKHADWHGILKHLVDGIESMLVPPICQSVPVVVQDVHDLQPCPRGLSNGAPYVYIHIYKCMYTYLYHLFSNVS